MSYVVHMVMFCVAKTKFDDPEGEFWLILLGTDRLETSFGNYRTMIGNDANTDCYQLSTRITGAMECSAILASHPSWDRGPRRLGLPTGRFLC